MNVYHILKRSYRGDVTLSWIYSQRVQTFNGSSFIKLVIQLEILGLSEVPKAQMLRKMKCF